MANNRIAEALAQLKAEQSAPSPGGTEDYIARAEALARKFEEEEKAQAEAARQPAQMPAKARPGDSGLLPEPKFTAGDAVDAVGDFWGKQAKGFAAAFNDTVSGGAIPRAMESNVNQGKVPTSLKSMTDEDIANQIGPVGLRVSVPPGTHQQAMADAPVAATLGNTAGIAAVSQAAPVQALNRGAGIIASGLRNAGAFASPTVEKAVASGIASAGYGAGDAAMRGGTPEQVFDAGMTSWTIGAGAPIVVGGMSKAWDATGKKLFSHQADPLVKMPVEITPENIGIVDDAAVAGQVPGKAPPEPKPYSYSDRIQKKGMLDKSQELLNAAVRRNTIKGTGKIEIGAAMAEALEAKSADVTRQKTLGIPIEVHVEGEGVASGAAKAVASSAERLGLERDLLGSIPEFTRKVLIKRNQIGQQIGKFTGSTVDNAGNRIDVLPTPGVRMDAILRSFEDELKKTAEGTARHTALLSEIDKIRGLYGESNVVANIPRIPIWKVSDLAQDAAMKGYGVTPISSMDLRESQKIAQIINRCLRRPMYDEVNRVLVRNPSLGSPEKFAKLRAEYTEASGLADIAMSARPQAYLGRPSLIESVKELGEKIGEHKAEAALSAPAITAGYMLGGKTGAAIAGAIPLAKPIISDINAKLAKAIVSARSGASAEGFSSLANSLGIDPAIASTIWQRYGTPAVGFSSSRAAEPQSSQEQR